MRRREFITLVAGAAATWPRAARAQQTDRMQRIGVIFGGNASDPDVQARLAAFLQALQQLGWTEGRNVRIESRFGAGNADNIRKHAAELAALVTRHDPGGVACGHRATAEGDPHRTDYVRDSARSGRRGPRQQSVAARRQRHRLYAVRIQFDREMAGTAERDRARREASGRPSGGCLSLGIGQFAVIQYVAPSVGVEVSPIRPARTP